MKSGFNATVDEPRPYWVLPDKPMERPYPGANRLDWSLRDTRKRVDEMKEYLSGILEPNSWEERNFRFFFERKEDFEMFQLMCVMKWSA